MTFIPILTFTELWVVSMEHMQRVWLASRERLPFRTPGSVPHLGLANVPIVETKFLELAMSLLDFSPRIPLGTFSNLPLRLGYCFTPYLRLWLYNVAPLVAFYDTLVIRRMYSQLKPPASARGLTPRVTKTTAIYWYNTFHRMIWAYVFQWLQLYNIMVFIHSFL